MNQRSEPMISCDEAAYVVNVTRYFGTEWISDEGR